MDNSLIMMRLSSDSPLIKELHLVALLSKGYQSDDFACFG